MCRLILVAMAALAVSFLGEALDAERGRAPTLESAMRFHIGNDANASNGWAEPGFDDSSWTASEQGAWPRPAYHSDGFVCVRLQAPVRADAAEPFSLRVSALSGELLAYEVFVNGTRVGSFGRVPPGERLESLPRAVVFDLPSGLVRAGDKAQIAIRVWYPPFVRRKGGRDTIVLEFDQSRTLHAEAEVEQQRALLRNVPLMLINVLVLLLGSTVAWAGYSSRNRDVRLCGLMLGSLPLLPLFLQIVDARVIDISASAYFPLQVIAQLPPMFMSVVFIWGINGFKDVFFKRLMLAAMVVFNTASLAAFVPSAPSPLVTASIVALPIGLRAFDILNVGANTWAFFNVRRNRVIAVTMMLVPVASLIHGLRAMFEGQGTNYFDLTFTSFGICLAAVLAQRAWAEWRMRDALQTEFETAREVQQRLVPTAVDVPGFRIESAYKPAKHVGGDSFYIRPDEEGGVLVVVGDVSGKGLKAAMTVSTMIGALRTMPALPPAGILAALNRGLVGQMQGGFVTCCVASISHDGKLTFANAGHIPPYVNGKEIALESGLPLGLAAEATYTEATLSLPPNVQLTLLTDGIAEARNASGELFGFDRTLQLSNRSANEIAQAAVDFGQEDDITVLTLTRQPGVERVPAELEVQAALE
jgi:phosphoserine phosphatase RsbU/P